MESFDAVLAELENSILTPNDITRLAGSLGTSKGAVEKDYVISKMLAIFTESPSLNTHFDKLVFKGGTAIKKAYFSDTRFSVDLDFSALPEFDPKPFLRGLKEAVERRYLGGLQFRDLQSKTRRRELGLHVRLLYDSVLAPRSESIRMEISLRKPMLKLLEQPIDTSPYFRIKPNPTIQTLSLGEILAEKARALLDRCAPRDMFDVWYLNKVESVGLDTKLLGAKLSEVYRTTPSEKERLHYRSLEDPKSAIPRINNVSEEDWNNELGALLTKRINVSLDEVKNFIVNDFLAHLPSLQITG